ncbi:hypothetical protein Cgig2_008064 [Carnegiea gigantea]|uniref:FAR1-related sequence 11-like HTH-like domain-containing protein n=1 Tax=Carnegiea gigantea TaxID=171969 RepID=A0A9Q1QUX4_9CARY|nr:hypothetical protein Cgig2_008064 [Carnegiea gigantea]
MLSSSLTVRQIIRVLELEKNVVHGELPFLEKNICNLFTKVRKQLAGNDVKPPKTIITYQYPWMTEIHKLKTIKEFESQWDVTVGRFDLQDNKHIPGACLSPKLLLWRNDHHEKIGVLNDFVKQIDVAIQEIRQRNLHDDMLGIQKINVLKFSHVLTQFAPKKFKEESSGSIQYLILYASGNNFILRYYEGSHNRNHQKDSHKIASTCLPFCWCLQHYNHELDVLEGQISIDRIH